MARIISHKNENMNSTKKLVFTASLWYMCVDVDKHPRAGHCRHEVRDKVNHFCPTCSNHLLVSTLNRAKMSPLPMYRAVLQLHLS